MPDFIAAVFPKKRQLGLELEAHLPAPLQSIGYWRKIMLPAQSRTDPCAACPESSLGVYEIELSLALWNRWWSLRPADAL